MPAVALLSKPNGAPIASTHSPTLRVRESPIFTMGRFVALILISAMSERVSMPITLAGYSWRSVRRTITSLAPFTTCAFVMIRPSERMMKPEPSPCIGCGRGAWKPKLRKNGANGLFGPKGSSLPLLLPSPSPSPFSSLCQAVDTLLVTVMLTTAGPYFCTMPLKSGNAATGLTAAAGADADAATAGACAVVLAAACAAPEKYSAPTGTATVAAPSIAITSGLRTRETKRMNGSSK